VVLFYGEVIAQGRLAGGLVVGVGELCGVQQLVEILDAFQQAASQFLEKLALFCEIAESKER